MLLQNFVERIVQRVAFDNVALTLLLIWTGLMGIARIVMHDVNDFPAMMYSDNRYINVFRRLVG